MYEYDVGKRGLDLGLWYTPNSIAQFVSSSAARESPLSKPSVVGLHGLDRKERDERGRGGKKSYELHGCEMLLASTSGFAAHCLRPEHR